MSNEAAFGAALRELRLLARLTQEQLAEKAGVSSRTIRDLERGVVLGPRATTASLLADALALSPVAREEFFDVAHAARWAHRTALGQRDPLAGMAPVEHVPSQLSADEPPISLLRDPVVTHPAVAPAPLEAPASPFQIPSEVPNFVGRANLVDRIRSLLTPAESGDTATVGLVLSGPPGVGKTALAIHVSHRLKSAFPDGQLYLNMFGYSRSAPMPPGGALARFLRALGTAPDRIPVEVDEQSALFRTVLNGRRVLVVLDNVITADQVRPLLPNGPNCAILVTSRDVLAGLSAINGMRLIVVEPVTSREALALATTILGARVAQEPAAAAELATLCGNLPLAVRIAAANLAARPGQSIESYVDALRREDRIAALAISGDDAAAVEVAFELSYRTLDPDAAQMFQLLGTVPGSDFDRYAAANLADVDLHAAARILDRLADANLLQRSLNRYHFHDLIREYARRQSLLNDQDSTRQAIRRLFDFYLDTADEATRLLHPDLPRLTLPATLTGRLRPSVGEPIAAAGWLDAEITNMEAMVCLATPGGDDLPVWLLADAMVGHVDRQRLDSSWFTICTAARDAATRSGEVRGEAAMHRALGKYYYQQTQYDRAEELYLRACSIYEEIGDRAGHARGLNGLASVAGSLLNYAKAIDVFHVALQVCHTIGDRGGEAEVLTNLGTSLVLIGSADEGITYLSQARTVAAQLDLHHIDPRAQSAIALNDLYSGRLNEAKQRLDDVLTVCQRIGYRTIEAQTLRNIAEVYLEHGRPECAIRAAEEALALADQINDHWDAVGARVTLSQVALALGDAEAAARHLADADGLRASTVHFWYPFATLAIAACERLAGNSGRALELVGDTVLDPRPRVRTQADLEFARAYLSLENCSSSLAYAQRACETAEHSGYQLDLARALAVSAEIYDRMGDPGRAAAFQARAQAIQAEVRGIGSS